MMTSLEEGVSSRELSVYAHSHILPLDGVVMLYLFLVRTRIVKFFEQFWYVPELRS